jgi:hypothetical protein
MTDRPSPLTPGAYMTSPGALAAANAHLTRAWGVAADAALRRTLVAAGMPAMGRTPAGEGARPLVAPPVARENGEVDVRPTPRGHP